MFTTPPSKPSASGPNAEAYSLLRGGREDTPAETPVPSKAGYGTIPGEKAVPSQSRTLSSPRFSFRAVNASSFRSRTVAQGGSADDTEIFERLCGSYLRASLDPIGSIYALPRPSTKDSLDALEVYASRWTQWPLTASLMVLLLLPFFETHAVWGGPISLCSALEFMALMTLLWASRRKRRFMGSLRFNRDPSAVLHAAFVLILLMDLVSYVLNTSVPIPHEGDDAASWGTFATVRFLRALRPFVALDSLPRVRQRLIDLGLAARDSSSPIILLFTTIGLFAMAGVVLFHGTETGRLSFATLEDAVTSLIVLTTTCNSPTILAPSFIEDRFYALYFVTFLLLVHFFILNLVLGVVYFEQKSLLRKAASLELASERVFTRCAMLALSSSSTAESAAAGEDSSTRRLGESVPYDLVVRSIEREFHFIEPNMPRELLRKCGVRIGEPVSREAFTRLPLALKLGLSGAIVSSLGSFEYDEDWAYSAEEDAGLELEGAPGRRGARVARFLRRIFMARPSPSGSMTCAELAVVAVLLCDIGLSIVELKRDVDEFGALQDFSWSVVHRFEKASIAFVTLEMILKFFAFGPTRFFDDPWNTFDAFLVSGAFSGLILGLMGVRVRYARLLRDIRFLRLARVVPSFRNLLENAAAFMHVFVPFFGVLVLVYYMAAIISVGILGHVRLPPAEYAANDFRDFSAALMTLFELTVVNDWNRTMYGFLKATNGSRAVESLFVFWWALSSLLLINCVTSLILEAFDVEMSRRRLMEALHVGDKEDSEDDGDDGASRDDRTWWAGFTTMGGLLRRPSGEAPSMEYQRRVRRLDSFGGPVDPQSMMTNVSHSSMAMRRALIDLFRDLPEPEESRVDRRAQKLVFNRVYHDPGGGVA